MSNELKERLEKMIKTSAQLDEKSLLLLQNSADTLLLRQRMEENEPQAILKS